MKLDVKKNDSANAVVEAVISAKFLEDKINALAKDAAKDMKIDGFRAGKVPTHVVKARYGEKLTQDAEAAALQELLARAVSELKISNSDIIGEPQIPKFDKKDGAIELEVLISIRPEIDINGYKDVIPEVEDQDITTQEVDDRIADLASAQAALIDITEDRGLVEGDTAIFDFDGYIDGVAFDGGKAENFSLKIGSGQFIPGFEDGMIGLKVGDEKSIMVTFPEDYQAENLKGKESEFKVKIHNIQIKDTVEINEETAKAMMPGDENASVEKLKEQIREQIKSEKMSTYYSEKLKPLLLEALVSKFNFDMPKNVVEQEIDNQLNNQVRDMSESEIEELKKDTEKVKEMREGLRQEATKSVKLTFIIDSIAKVENVNVSDEEMTQAIRYEAMMYAQDADAILKQYQEQGLLPIIKMSMIEDRLVTKLLDEKLGNK